MAIPQERYVRITSSNVGNSAIQERDLNGLLFTLGRGWIGQGAFGTDSILKCYSVDQVRKYFSSASDEVKFAQKYFAYISPSGSSPASLSFARVGVYSDDPSEDPTAKLLSYQYGETDPNTHDKGYGWFIPKTAGKVVVTIFANPENGFSLPVLIGSSEQSADASKETDYTFVNTVMTSRNQILIGENAAQTAENFAAVVNGTGGFYGQMANEYVVATVDGSTVTLTAKFTGLENTPWVTPSSPVTSVTTPGNSTETYCGTPSFESPDAALSRVNTLSNNFGSFAILAEDITEASWSNTDLNDLLTQNAGYNYKYLASVPILPNGGDLDDTSNEIAFVTAVGTQNGAAANRGKDGTVAAIPMAIFGAIDYGGTNTAPNFMFKQIAGETPSVTSSDIADTLDGIHVNYYGQTQVNGRALSFYQRGFNLDGEDTAVYCNEVWLKSHIATAIFNLLVSVERVPANDDGESMLYTTIAGAAQQAVTNGTIEPGKTFTAAQRATIYQLTGDPEAYMTMQNAGYWLDVVIEQDGNEYKAVYKLVYGKGDSVRFVEGHDVLI